MHLTYEVSSILVLNLHLSHTRFHTDIYNIFSSHHSIITQVHTGHAYLPFDHLAIFHLNGRTLQVYLYYVIKRRRLTPYFYYMSIHLAEVAITKQQ